MIINNSQLWARYTFARATEATLWAIDIPAVYCELAYCIDTRRHAICLP